MRQRMRFAGGLATVVAMLLLGGQSRTTAASDDPSPADNAAKTSEAEGQHAASKVEFDPYDLTHQNAGPMLEDPSEFRSDLAIWTFVVFLGLLAILGKFAWRPVMDGLEKRERSIAHMIDEAKQSADKAAEQLRHYEARLAAAGAEARDLMAKAQREAEAAKDRIVAEARQAAERERERAVADIENAKNTALQEITQKSVDLAVLMAGRIVRRELSPEDHSRLIREALDELPSRN